MNKINILSLFDPFFGVYSDDFLGKRKLKNVDGNKVSSYSFKESNDEYILKLPLPGFKQEEIDISLENESLLIKASSTNPEYTMSSSFSYEYGLYPTMDKSKINADFQNGMLLISIKKIVENKEVIKIPIKSLK
jgi:HSP20 family molecular chaperone IbpA